MSEEKIDIEKTLQELGIKFEKAGNYYYFRENDISFWVSNTGVIGVSSDYFGKIPHVMRDGSLCVSGNKEIKLLDNKKITFEKTISTYAPWLFSLPPNYCVAEMIAELDFYIMMLFQGGKCDEIKANLALANTLPLYIVGPSDLWEKIGLLENNIWYKLMPIDLENHYVFLKKENNDYKIFFDRYSKARMRVSGNKFNEPFGKIAFIGVGSVNSYIIKQLAGRGLNDVVLIDDDTIEVDNMYRHAFPYISKKKVDAAEYFITNTFVASSVTKFEVKIKSDSDNYLENVDTVYVSVDNYISWLDVILYLLDNTKKETTIILSGVDIFGSFGKFSVFHLSIDNKADFIRWALSFLEFVPPQGIERRQMIGNGCGKSIAIYSELDLLILANNISNNTKVGEIFYVPFEN